MKEQVYATNALLIMTVFNFLVGVLIVTEVVPLFYGLGLATVGMSAIVWRTKRELMGDEKLWHNPKRNKKNT